MSGSSREHTLAARGVISMLISLPSSSLRGLTIASCFTAVVVNVLRDLTWELVPDASSRQLGDGSRDEWLMGYL